MAAPRRQRSERVPQYESEAYTRLTKSLALNLRRLRVLRGWTQEEAGHRCGMLMQQYQRVESGAVNVTLTTLARLSEGYGVAASELLAHPEDGAPRPPEGPEAEV